MDVHRHGVTDRLDWWDGEHGKEGFQLEDVHLKYNRVFSAVGVLI